MSARRPQLRVAGLLVLACSAAGAAAADAGTNYRLHCEGCHLDDGRGTPGIVPTLRGDFGRIAAMPGGRDYLMRVPGVAMSPLPSDALAGVLNWVMDSFNAGTRPAGFVPFAAAEVAQARRRPLANPLVRRGELVSPAAGVRSGGR